MTSTATSTSTTGYPEPKVIVSKEVQKAVTDLVKAEASAEGKHWIAVEEGLKRFEAGIEFTEIVKEFQQAFWIANSKEGKEVSSSIRNAWYQKAYRIGNIVVKGREWVAKKRELGTSFTASFYEAKPSTTPKEVPTPSPLPDSVGEEQTTNGEEASKPSLSNRSGKGKGKGSKQPADRIKVDQRSEFDRVFSIIDDQPDMLMELIEGLVSKGKLAYIDLIKDLLEKLAPDAKQSLVQSLFQPKPVKKAKAKELKDLSELQQA